MGASNPACENIISWMRGHGKLSGIMMFCVRQDRVLRLIVLGWFYLLVGCNSAPVQDDLAAVLLAETGTPHGLSASAVTQTPTSAATPTAAATATNTGTLETGITLPARIETGPAPEIGVCSPLQGYSYDDLQAAISNPFKPPARQGSDDPHQAVDLAVLQGTIALAGKPAYAVLPGIVATVIIDRFPYGHALLVETPLDALPVGWLAEIQIPTPAPTLGPHPSLTCPQSSDFWDRNSDRRSLYLLYAHFQEPVAYQVEDRVDCADQVGIIGQSGNALAPHLHLEGRVGPSGARFGSLAHYTGGIDLEEMSAYCAWRVSGSFQLINPLRILALLP